MNKPCMVSEGSFVCPPIEMSLFPCQGIYKTQRENPNKKGKSEREKSATWWAKTLRDISNLNELNILSINWCDYECIKPISVLTTEWPVKEAAGTWEASPDVLTSTFDHVQLLKSKACNDPQTLLENLSTQKLKKKS